MINIILKKVLSLILIVILIGTFNVFTCFAYDSNEFNDEFDEGDFEEIVGIIPLGFTPIGIDDVLVSQVFELDDDWNEDWIVEESEYDNWSKKQDKEKSEDDHHFNKNWDIEKINDDDWNVDWDYSWYFKFHNLGNEVEIG